jgi:hypothetical protein
VTGLNTLVEPIKREIAVPGEFATTFPNTRDEDLLRSLADGFAQAQLDGYFATSTLSGDWVVSPDLSAAGGALVVIYTGMRICINQLRASSSSSRYKAGPVEYETSKGSTLLKAELDYWVERRKDLLQQARSGARRIHTIDAYYARSVVTWGSFSDVGTFYDWERP